MRTFLLIAITLYVIASIIFIIRNLKRSNELYEIESFKSNEDIYKLPIVSMYEGEVKLNFLVDTGSTHSHLVPSILKQIHYTEKDDVNTPFYGYGGPGDSVQSKIVTLKLNHNFELVEGDFMVHNTIEDSLDQAFSMYPNIKIHGILGNDFLKRNKYIIDYSDFSIKKNK